MNYYNEFEPYAAQWLRNLIEAGLIPAGHVDTRSIIDVQASDLIGYRQCHFFAGIGGWSLAARLAGWPDDRELWTGSAPCQPFSVAGKGKAQGDDRHLWPHLFRLASARRPAVLMGEQVAAAVGKDWLDGVCSDMEGIGYASRAAVVPACAVDAPHRRDRLWFVARSGVVGNGISEGLEGFAGHGDDAAGWEKQNRPASAAGGCSVLADSDGIAGGQVHSYTGGCDTRGGAGQVAGPCGARDGDVADAAHAGGETQRGHRLGAHHDTRGNRWIASRAGGAWDGAGWIIGHDGKARRVEPSIRLLAHGVPGRVGRLRAYGNAIVPQVAAEVIGAYMDCYPNG